MFNTYILSYDPLAKNYSINQLHTFVRSNAFTYQYYFMSAGTYFIKSSAQLNELIDSYSGFFDGANYVLALISPKQTGGALPLPVWDWFNADAPPPLLGPKVY